MKHKLYSLAALAAAGVMVGVPADAKAAVDERTAAASLIGMVVRFDHLLASGVPDIQESAFWASAYLMLSGSEESWVLPMRCFGWSQPKAPMEVSVDSSSFTLLGAKNIVIGENKGGYKVWAGGVYHLFDSEEEAATGRAELEKRGFISGPVQRTSAKPARKPTNVFKSPFHS